MNIIYLTNHLNIGGITSYVLSLAAGLKKRGHNIYVASSGGQLLSRLAEEGINYIPIPIKTKKEVSPKILACMFKILPILKRQRIDIIHSNSRTTQVLGYLLGRKIGIPYVSTCHGFFKKRFFRNLLPCWGIKVIAISESVKEHLIKDFKAKDKDIVVIHNGIEINKYRIQNTEYRVQKKKDLGLSDGPVIGVVARLSEVKGHIYLIQAMKAVLAKIPQAQLLIVGDGKEKKALVKLINELGIQRNVFLIPSVTQTNEILSIMDIFVLPSLKEGLGLSLIEAMACGLAVIGSDTGGIRSLIRDGHNGLLVKPADSEGLASAILELLKSSVKAKEIARQARIFVSQNFSLDKMVLETERVYLECLNAKH